MLADRAHIYPLATAVLWGGVAVLVGILPWVKVQSGKLFCIWSLRLELLAIHAYQEARLCVEFKDSRNGQGRDNLWGCEKGMGFRASITAAGEVPVVGGDDGALLPLLDVVPVPLADARVTSIGKDDSTHNPSGSVHSHPTQWWHRSAQSLE